MTKNTLTRDQIKDFKKRPGFYFHSQKEERLKHAEDVIESISNQNGWADISDDDAPISGQTPPIPLHELETVVPHQFYKGNIRMMKGHVTRHQIGVLGLYPNLIFFDFDTCELRHPLEVEHFGDVLAKNLGEALQGAKDLYEDIEPYLSDHAFRLYMTQRGVRCIEVGAFYEWDKYPRIALSLPRVAEGDIKLDLWHIQHCIAPNTVGAVTKEEVMNLKMPPVGKVLLDRPSEPLWVSAMPILEWGTPGDLVGKFVDEHHDQVCMESMTPERMEFFWSELKRRLPSLGEEMRENVIEFVNKKYEEVDL